MKFTIDIEPRPAPRPRENGRMLKWYKEYKQALAWSIKAKLKGITFEGAMCVNETVFIQTPKSWSKKKTEKVLKAYTEGHYEKDTPVPNGDRDNYDKAILDAITDAGAWKEDKFVIDGRIQKKYATSSYIEIEIIPLAEDHHPLGTSLEDIYP